MNKPRLFGPLLLAACMLTASPAFAGPPYVTDDPEPTDPGHWEVYAFASGARLDGGVTEGEGGLDINYGAAPDLQLTLVLPGAYERDGRTHAGLGDIEIAAKYLFLHQQEGGLVPDVSFFPEVIAPTASNRFGSGRWGLFLPLWAEKDFGPWEVFGGGGYEINPGPGQKDFWTGGLAVQREVGDRLALGAEIYHQTRDAIDGKPFTGMSLGASYRVTPHWSVLASGGPGLENVAEGGRYAFYFALKADY